MLGQDSAQTTMAIEESQRQTKAGSMDTSEIVKAAADTMDHAKVTSSFALNLYIHINVPANAALYST